MICEYCDARIFQNYSGLHSATSHVAIIFNNGKTIYVCRECLVSNLTQKFKARLRIIDMVQLAKAKNHD